jgi:protein-S-isoprenylcysteine O-methyltransferase Ste14
VIEQMVFTVLLPLSFTLACVTIVLLSFFTAPYGRHSRANFGSVISNRLGWLFMEAPAAIVFLVLFWVGSVPRSVTLVVFLLMWEAHYIHRSFIYPFRIADGSKVMPVLIVGLGLIFNTGNAYLNGRDLFELSGGYSPSWLLDPRFLIGAVLFIIGYVINRWADRQLRLLRAPGYMDYRIPRGGLYRWISCPNYLGEIIEWTGWAVATWSLPGLAFAVWTFANLAPCARAHHRWYRVNFVEYPPERKALLPGLW